MSGTGTVTKLASNTLTFDGDNTYTGDTTVSAGTLQIGAGGTSGSIAGNIISNSNVTFSRSDTHIYAGVISGTGSLTNDGGFFRLTNDNTYTGATILTSGQIQIGAPGGSTGSIASQSILFNGGNFFDSKRWRYYLFGNYEWKRVISGIWFRNALLSKQHTVRK